MQQTFWKFKKNSGTRNKKFSSNLFLENFYSFENLDNISRETKNLENFKLQFLEIQDLKIFKNFSSLRDEFPRNRNSML